MKIKHGLVFSKRIVDLGNDIEQLAADDSHHSQGQLADQMLLSMARAVTLVVPVAHFPSLCLMSMYVHV